MRVPPSLEVQTHALSEDVRALGYVIGQVLAPVLRAATRRLAFGLLSLSYEGRRAWWAMHGDGPWTRGDE